MKGQKFLNIKTEPSKEKKEVELNKVSINPLKLVTNVVIGSIVVAAVVIVGHSVFTEYNQWKNAWQQVKFAKNNPEIVRVVQNEYELKLSNVQKEFLKTDSINGMTTTLTASNSGDVIPKR